MDMAAPAPQKSDGNPYFKPVMSGLAVGSGSFLLLRYVFRAAIDPSLIVAAFIGVAVAVFLVQRPK